MKRICKLSVSFAVVFMAVQAVVGASDKMKTSVTFSKDVAPILFKNCASCHRPNQVAPMSFLSYKEVRPWAKSICEAVLKGEMPPWYADPQHGEFANDRRLSQKEIDTLVAWVDGGATEGNPKDLPAPPKFPDGDWMIGTPDAVLSMPQEVNVPAAGVVPYQFLIVPTNFTEDRYIQAAEIRRGSPGVVHHVIITVMEARDGNGRTPRGRPASR